MPVAMSIKRGKRSHSQPRVHCCTSYLLLFLLMFEMFSWAHSSICVESAAIRKPNFRFGKRGGVVELLQRMSKSQQCTERLTQPERRSEATFSSITDDNNGLQNEDLLQRKIQEEYAEKLPIDLAVKLYSILRRRNFK